MENLILCFETGGTKLVAVMFDGQGSVLERVVLKRPPGHHALDTVNQLCYAGKALAGRFSRPSAVGWGFGGTVDRSAGSPAWCYHEAGWGTFDAMAMLRGELGDVPIFVENDCNMGALAEAWSREAGPPEMLFFATLGTGIGGGIVRNGELQQFSREGEGEIGHLVVEPGGALCACGNRGCLEAYCSGPGMSNLAESVTGRRMDSYKIMENFRNGDPECRKILEKGADYMSLAMSAVINILAPDEIVLGGGLMWENRDDLEMIEEKSKARAFPIFRNRAVFRLSELGNELVSRGAYYFARYQLDRLQI